MPEEKKLSRQELLRHEVKNQTSCLRRMLKTSDGEEAMKLLEATFFNETSIVPNDPYATHAREGAREVIIFLRGILNDEH